MCSEAGVLEVYLGRGANDLPWGKVCLRWTGDEKTDMYSGEILVYRDDLVGSKQVFSSKITISN